MSDGLKDAIEVAVLAIIAIVLVVASAFITHDIDASKLAKVQAADAKAASLENQALLKQYADAVLDKQRLQTQADNAASDAAAQIAKGQNDLQSLNDCIAAGKCGLHVRTIRAACPASVGGGSVPATANADTSTDSELDGQAQQAYNDLRAAIVQVQGQMKACQDYARTMQSTVQTGKVTK